MKTRPPLRILGADDDMVLLARLAASLRRRGHEVVTASGLEEVAGLLRGFSPEFAVIDLRLDGEIGRAHV